MTVIQTNVEDEITRLSAELESATGVLAERAQEAANCEIAHKREYAKAILLTQGKNQAEREADAHLLTENWFATRKISEASHASQLEIVRSLRSQLSALQTLVRVISDQVSSR